MSKPNTAFLSRLFRALVFSLLLPLPVVAGEGDEQQVLLDPLVITATAIPSSSDLGRMVEVITEDDLERVKAGSLGEALERLTSVSVSERGASGVQADLSIRGSSSDQVLVAMDGLPLMDPQTSHHNMDLPFGASSVEQVEVIPGPGSALFGPSAFAGVVNIVPKRPDSSMLYVKSSYGSYGSGRAFVSGDLAKGPVANSLSSAYSSSQGFMEGAVHQIWLVWDSFFVEGDGHELRASVGHVNKDFGAKDFYSPYPSRENTATTLLDLAPKFEIKPDLHLKLSSRYRRHDDEFILIENDPSFYKNQHLSESYVNRLLVTWKTTRYVTALGFERKDDYLDSSNLGDRYASVSSGFVNQRICRDKWVANLGLRLDSHPEWGAVLSPSVSGSFEISRRLTVRASVASAFRPPNMTELYYADPENIGNPDLGPEKAWGYEAGLDMETEEAILSLTVFGRDTEDLIDWVREEKKEPWRAANIGRAYWSGTELSLQAKSGGPYWRAAYSYTDLDASRHGFESKYALNYARHDLLFAVGSGFSRNWYYRVDARYKQVPELDDHVLLNANLSYEREGAELFVKGLNLLDYSYEEIPDVPVAGLYLEAGIKLMFY